MTTQLKDKIIPNPSIRTIEEIKNRFSTADKILGTENQETSSLIKKTVIRKTFSLPEEDLSKIEVIKDRVLNKKIILSDSEVLRLGIQMLFELKEEELYAKATRINKMQTGRPKKY